MIVSESSERKIVNSKANGLRLVGKGNEYLVYDGIVTEDGIERYIKEPKRHWYYGLLKPYPTREIAEEDYRTVATYFNSGAHPIFADTVFWGNGRNYRVLQEKIACPRDIRRRDMRDPAIVAQLQDVLKRNNTMLQETGKSLGIIGQEGTASLFYLKPKITNVLLQGNTDSPQIQGIDFGLLHQNTMLGKLAIWGNAFVLSTFFGVNMRGEKTRSPFAPRISRGK